MLKYIIGPFILSALLNFIFIFFAFIILKKLDIIGKKKSLQSDDRRLPSFGGITIFISYCIALFYFSLRGNFLTSEIKLLIASSAIIVMFGVIDDIVELPALIKLIGQLIGASVLVFFGVSTRIILMPHFLNVIISLLWIVGITNAVNLLDIADGLSAGVALISSLTLLILGIIEHDITVILIAASLSGALLSFLVFNFPPAKIFMGDAGSLFVGFTLSVIAILAHYATEKNPVALLAPILALGLPLFDVTFVTFSRLVNGRSIFKKSNDHFVFKIASMGIGVRKAVICIYMLTVFFSVSTFIVCFGSNLAAFLALLVTLIMSMSIGFKAITFKAQSAQR